MKNLRSQKPLLKRYSQKTSLVASFVRSPTLPFSTLLVGRVVLPIHSLVD